MNLQALVDGMSVQWQKERSETQMTLGGLIDRLEQLPPEMLIAGLGSLTSYRGYYSDLAFEPTTDQRTAADLLKQCRGAMGEVFHGYKGGEYQMGRTTPLWFAEYGCTGQKLMAVTDDGALQLADDE